MPVYIFHPEPPHSCFTGRVAVEQFPRYSIIQRNFHHFWSELWGLRFVRLLRRDVLKRETQLDVRAAEINIPAERRCDVASYFGCDRLDGLVEGAPMEVMSETCVRIGGSASTDGRDKVQVDCRVFPNHFA